MTEGGREMKERERKERGQGIGVNPSKKESLLKKKINSQLFLLSIYAYGIFV